MYTDILFSFPLRPDGLGLVAILPISWLLFIILSELCTIGSLSAAGVLYSSFFHTPWCKIRHNQGLRINMKALLRCSGEGATFSTSGTNSRWRLLPMKPSNAVQQIGCQHAVACPCVGQQNKVFTNNWCFPFGLLPNLTQSPFTVKDMRYIIVAYWFLSNKWYS